MTTTISALLNAKNQVWTDTVRLARAPVGTITVKTDINTAAQTRIAFGFVWRNVNNIGAKFLGVGKKRKSV